MLVYEKFEKFIQFQPEGGSTHAAIHYGIHIHGTKYYRVLVNVTYRVCAASRWLKHTKNPKQGHV